MRDAKPQREVQSENSKDHGRTFAVSYSYF